jgi:hypothetical protein
VSLFGDAFAGEIKILSMPVGFVLERTMEKF